MTMAGGMHMASESSRAGSAPQRTMPRQVKLLRSLGFSELSKMLSGRLSRGQQQMNKLPSLMNKAKAFKSLSWERFEDRSDLNETTLAAELVRADVVCKLVVSILATWEYTGRTAEKARHVEVAYGKSTESAKEALVLSLAAMGKTVMAATTLLTAFEDHAHLHPVDYPEENPGLSQKIGEYLPLAQALFNDTSGPLNEAGHILTALDNEETKITESLSFDAVFDGSKREVGKGRSKDAL